jgi:hypothetical protein
MSNEPLNLPPEPERHTQREFTAEGSRIRRRRTRNMEIPASAEGQAELIQSLAHRAHPSFELFIYALLSGTIIALGFWLNAPPIWFIGVLLTPLMTFWVGMLLALIVGSPKFLFETFMAFLISAVMVFLIGVLTGFASQVFPERALDNAFYFARLWVPQLIIVVLGSILLIASFVRSESKPFLPSLVVAFTFYLPLSSAGFGLGSGVQGMWPEGILVFLVHFGLASVVGVVTLIALRIRPTPGGMILTGGAVLFLLISVGIIMFGGSSQNSGSETPQAVTVESQTAPIQNPGLDSSQQANPTPMASLATSKDSATGTATPITPTPVPLTLTVTLPATETPTVTLTIEPTPVYAKISAAEGGGANLRKTPNGKFVATLDNGTIVQVLPDIMEVNSVTWIHIIAPKNGVYLEGWVLQSVLTTATPVPNWDGTVTATP